MKIIKDGKLFEITNFQVKESKENLKVSEGPCGLNQEVGLSGCSDYVMREAEDGRKYCYSSCGCRKKVVFDGILNGYKCSTEGSYICPPCNAGLIEPGIYVSAPPFGATNPTAPFTNEAYRQFTGANWNDAEAAYWYDNLLFYGAPTLTSKCSS